MNKKSHLFLPSIIFSIVLLMAFIIYNHSAATVQKESEQQFINSSEQLLGALITLIDLNLNTAEAVVAFFHASAEVSRDQFNTFGSKVIGNHPEIQTINWIAHIDDEQRKSYEESMINQGFVDFTIHNGYQNNQLISAPKKDSYFPIHYLVPFEENKKAFGFDAISPSLKRAISTQKYAISNPLTLVQEQAEQKSVLVFFPVFKSSSLQGLVQLVLRMGDVTAQVNTSFEHNNILMTVFDVSGESPQGMVSGTQPSSLENSPFYYEKTLVIGGRQWKVEFTPKPTFILYNQSEKKSNQLVFLAGIGLAFFIAFILPYIIRQRNTAERNNQLLAVSQHHQLSQQKALDAHAIVSVTDLKGNITYVNKQFEEMSGYSEDELLGKNHSLLNSSFHPKSFFNDLYMTIKNGDVWHGQIRNKAKDGSYYWVKTTIAPLLNGKNKTKQYISIRTDISEVKHSKERLLTAVEATGDGLWDWNILTGEFIISPLYQKMLGYAPVEVITHIDTWTHSVHPDDLPRVQETLNNYFENKTKTYEVELRLKCKDNGWKWVLCRGKVLTRDNAGKQQTMMGIHTDISSRKEMEVALIAEKEEATRANKAKSEFLSSMSHELRTPLNAILGFGQLLESDTESPLTDGQKESVDYILSGGHHLLALINQVLELSAIEAGEVALTLESINLNKILKECEILIQNSARKNNISLKIEYDESEILVLADYTKLKQILINLVSNAIKYNRDNGAVTITCSTTQDNNVRINIVDTGIGIPKNKLQQIFTPFNRLGQERSTIEGSGIGLVVTKQLVEIMAGTIGFDSIENKGSTFWVEFPTA